MKTLTTLSTLALTALLLTSCTSNDQNAPQPVQETTEATTTAPVTSGPQEAADAPSTTVDQERLDQIVEEENELFQDMMNHPDGSAEQISAEDQLDALYEELEDMLGEPQGDDVHPVYYELALINFMLNMGFSMEQILTGDLDNGPADDEALTREFLDCDQDATLEECETDYEEQVNEDFAQWDLEECYDIVNGDMGNQTCNSATMEDAEFYELYEETYGHPIPDQHRN